MQRIEADAVGAELVGEVDEIGKIGEIAHPPVARRADAVELDGQQPAAVKIAGERRCGRRNQRRLVGGAGRVR